MCDKNNYWLEFYKKVYNEKQFFSDKAWKTIEFHILLSSSLISITIGALVLIYTSHIDKLIRVVLTSSLLFLPSTMFLILRVGSRNFRRECDRMYQMVWILKELEKREKDFSEEETYNLGRYYEETQNKTHFVKDMLCRQDKFYSIMNNIFCIFQIISCLLIGFITAILIGLLIGTTIIVIHK